MSDDVAAPAAVLPEVDDVLAAALEAQGEAGVRALGLLRDAHRVLADAQFARPAEVAAACVRSSADALLSLPGAPVTVGLLSAAKSLLAAVDAFPPPTAPPAPAAVEPAPPVAPPADADAVAAPAEVPPAVESADANAEPAGAPAGDGPAGTPAAAPAEPAAARGPVRQTEPAWERVTEAAGVLRTELGSPGRFHRARAQGIVEQLTGVRLGAAQEKALDVWGTLYSVASGILHGRSAGPGEAVFLYTELLGAARELMVPLPGRAARVLELAADEHPQAAEAKELAGWADPRATDYFLRSGPAPVWLSVLQEHAPHLLEADAAAGGRWPAAALLEHVAQRDPDTVRAWLTEPADAGATPVSRGQQAAAAGRLALDALLHLAVRHPDAVDAGQLRTVLTDTATVRAGGGPAVGATLRLAARWARAVPRAGRKREWILVVEALLAGAVDDEHAAHQSLQAVLERAAAAEDLAASAQETTPTPTAHTETAGVADVAPLTAAAVMDDDTLFDLIAQETAARLPGHEVAVLLRELARTAYPAGRSGPAHPHRPPRRHRPPQPLQRATLRQSHAPITHPNHPPRPRPAAPHPPPHLPHPRAGRPSDRAHTRDDQHSPAATAYATAP